MDLGNWSDSQFFSVIKCIDKRNIWILKIHWILFRSPSVTIGILYFSDISIVTWLWCLHFYVSPSSTSSVFLLHNDLFHNDWEILANLWSLLIPFNGTIELKWNDEVKQLIRCVNNVSGFVQYSFIIIRYYYLFSWERLFRSFDIVLGECKYFQLNVRLIFEVKIFGVVESIFWLML